MNLFRLLAFGGLALATPALAQAPSVDAPAGKVTGALDGEMRVFKGIPYALPPVKERRWQPPAPMPKWNGARDATQCGAACVQPVAKTPNI